MGKQHCAGTIHKCIIAAYILLHFHMKLLNSWVRINFSYQLRQIHWLIRHFFKVRFYFSLCAHKYLNFGWFELVKVWNFVSILIDCSSGMVDRKIPPSVLSRFILCYNFVFPLSTNIFPDTIICYHLIWDKLRVSNLLLKLVRIDHTGILDTFWAKIMVLRSLIPV